MLIVALWTKTVIGQRIVASGAVTFVNVFIWYYVLEMVVKNIDNPNIVFLYAAGCAVGTMLSGALSLMYTKEKQAYSQDGSALFIN